MSPEFSPERAEAIETALVAHVAHRPHRTRRKAWTAGLLLTGALAGAGASAGAFAATGMLHQADAPAAQQTADASAGPQPAAAPTPDLPDPVAAPAGVTPGSPVVSLLGRPASVNLDAAAQVPLSDRPPDATHARVTVTATSPGSLSWGTDPGGNNLWATWTSADFADSPSSLTWHDFPLDASVETLDVDPSNVTGVLTVEFVAYVPTLFGVNANGQSYGSSGGDQGEPDLVAVEATNGEFGYVYREELDEASGQTESFTSPEDALEWQESHRGSTLPVYRSDGTTQIGEFHVGQP